MIMQIHNLKLFYMTFEVGFLKIAASNNIKFSTVAGGYLAQPRSWYLRKTTIKMDKYIYQLLIWKRKMSAANIRKDLRNEEWLENRRDSNKKNPEAICSHAKKNSEAIWSHAISFLKEYVSMKEIKD